MSRHGPLKLCKKYGVRTIFGGGGLMVENALLLPLALFEAAADSLHAIDLLGVWGTSRCGSIPPSLSVRPPIVSSGLVQASLQVQ